MKIHVTHQEGEVFEASNTQHSITLGRGDCLRPMETLLASIASCASIDILLILEKQKLSFQEYSVDIQGERDEENIPSVFKNIEIDFRFNGDNLPLNKLQRAVKLTMNKYCSVSAMLNEQVDIKLTVTLNQISYEI